MTASDTTAAIIPAIHAVQQAVDPIEQTGRALRPLMSWIDPEE